MNRGADTSAILEQLRSKILGVQNPLPTREKQSNLGLGAIESAFPGGTFSRGGIHEFISTSSENAACTSGFISLVLNKLTQQNGFCLWISTEPRRSIFPPALTAFGLEPERVLFVDAKRPKETLWALEEALKCEALNAVVGELSELSFNDSRRLQLAVERSGVSGFIHRFRPRSQNAVACLSRWKITSLSSETHDNMPGLGFPRWNVELLKIRNGKPGAWQVQFSPKGLEYIYTGTNQQAEVVEKPTG